MTRISCPNDCAYLYSGSDYQQKRLAVPFASVRRGFYQELDQLGSHKAVALFNLIEIVTFGYFEGRRDGHDAEVVAASRPCVVRSARSTFQEHLCLFLLNT